MRSSAQGSDNPQLPSARISQHKLPNKADLSNAQKAAKKGKSEAIPAKESSELPDCLARYFSDKEFDKAIQESKQKSLPKVRRKQSDVYESDSNPSCDNIDQSQLKEMFKEALSDEDIKEVFGTKKEPKTSMKRQAEPGSECRKNQMTERGSPQISAANMNFVNTQKNKIVMLEESRAKVQKALEVKLQKERDRSEKVESSQLSTDQAVKRERIALLYRSGWNQIGGQTQYILKADNPAFSAGPRSGEIMPATQFNPHSTSYDQHGASYNFMQFPVVQGHNNESIQSKR